MIGILLLVIAILLYIEGKKVWSIFIFLSFVGGIGGFCLWVDTITGVKNEDLGFIYVVIINIYSYFYEKEKYAESHEMRNLILFFLIFMVCSIAVSFFYYEMTPIELVQGSRQIFYFTSYFFVRKLRKSEIKKIIYFVFMITLATSLPYIWQSLTGIEVLPNSTRYHSGDSITFLNRYYNSPPFLDLCILLVLLCNKEWGKKSYITMPILGLALLCTQGRTLILFVALFAIIGLWMQGNIKGQFKYILFVSLAFLLIGNVIIDRFEGQKSTSSDIRGFVQGDFVDIVDENGDGSTMSFRFAWCLERMYYLADRPVIENIFGLSLLSEQQPRLKKMYKFHIGNFNKETMSIAQLSTPDIAYGNMLTRFGYGGSILFLSLWVCMLKILHKSLRKNSFAFVGYIYILLMLFVSLAGRGIFNTGNMVIPFLFITYYLKDQEIKKIYAKYKVS